MKKVGWIALVLIALITAGWKGLVYRHHLHHVPEAMGVWRVTYAKEQAWGFGPGGNETGIILYAMPETISNAVATGGVEWLKSLPRDPQRGRSASHAEWHATPISPDLAWTPKQACESANAYVQPQYKCPGIIGYLGRYGFFIDYSAEADALVSDALFQPGAFYAFGRTGLLVVIPHQDRIAFIYAG